MCRDRDRPRRRHSEGARQAIMESNADGLRRTEKRSRGASPRGPEAAFVATVRGPLVKRPKFDCERPHLNSNWEFRDSDTNTAFEADQTVSEDFLHRTTPQLDASLLANQKSKGAKNAESSSGCKEKVLPISSSMAAVQPFTDGKAKNYPKRRKDAKQDLRSKIPGVTMVSDNSLLAQAANHIKDLEGLTIDFEGLSGAGMVRKVLPDSNKIRGAIGLFEAATRHITKIEKKMKITPEEVEKEDSLGVNAHDGQRYTMQLADNLYAQDGPVGKRLSNMIPIPHVPKINGEIPSAVEASADHQRVIDRVVAQVHIGRRQVPKKKNEIRQKTSTEGKV